MVYLKSALAGIVAALVASVMWLIVRLVLPLAIPLLVSRLTGDGAYGAGAYVDSSSIIVVALVGFVLGFYWQFRKARQSRA